MDNTQLTLLHRDLAIRTWALLRSAGLASRVRSLGFQTDSLGLSALVFLSPSHFSAPVEIFGGGLPLPEEVLLYVQSHA